MPATVTLAQATLTYGVDSGAGVLTLSSTAGIAPKSCLWIDRELFNVQRLIDGSTTQVAVSRGVDGTAAAPHSSSSVVWIGTPSQFFDVDPFGAPGSDFSVSPWINVHNGLMWLAQGDAQPNGQTYRWWQQVATTYGQGALGIRTQTQDPTVST